MDIIKNLLDLRIITRNIILTVFFICLSSCAFAAVNTDEAMINVADGKTKIRKIEFEGNQLINDSDIMKSLKMQVGDVYTKDLIQQNLKNIYDMGYFSEKMKAIPIPEDQENIVLKVYLQENIPVTGFTVDGNTVVPTGEILDILAPLQNKPQNINTLNNAIANIEELYASKGYILARVNDIQDDPDGFINIKMAEGTINSINIEGNKKTKDFVIQRNIMSTPGSIYNDNSIRADLMRLYGTQAFKDVNRTIERCEDDPNKYNVTIVLEEQRTGTISLGGGVDTATGLFGQVGFAENNFRGLGQRIALNFMTGTGIILSDSAMLKRANLQAELSWFEPRWKGTDNSVMVKAFGRDFSSYQVPLAIEQRYGAEVVVSRPIKRYKNLAGSFKVGVEHVKMKEGDEYQIANLYASHNVPISQRAEQLKGGTFLTLGPSLIYDTRDNSVNPRSGLFATLRYNENIGLTDFGTTHGTATINIKRYFPVMKKSSFSLQAKAGGTIHGDIPEVMAFRLGGPYSVRGYRMSAVGTGQGFVMGSAELTTPLFFIDRIKKMPYLDNIKLGMFVDAGQIYKGTITNQLYNRPERGISAGLGLRLFIPGVGPLSIDYGIPFTAVGDGNSKGAFTFGVGDFF